MFRLADIDARPVCRGRSPSMFFVGLLLARPLKFSPFNRKANRHD